MMAVLQARLGEEYEVLVQVWRYVELENGENRLWVSLLLYSVRSTSYSHVNVKTGSLSVSSTYSAGCEPFWSAMARPALVA
jgi:hypothetical protein